MSKLAKIATLITAIGLDQIGEPPAIIHPVVWYGRLISKLEQAAPRNRPAAELVYGGLMLVVAAPFALLPAGLIKRTARRLQKHYQQNGRPLLEIAVCSLINGVSLKPMLAARMLVQAGRSVRTALEQDDLTTARQELRSLVSRERDKLDAELVAAAAVESLAENLSDSVVAPLFYYALAGLPGAAFYRLCNTFDAMIGYRGRYEYLGKAAARLDDLLNLLPARLTALLIILLAPLYDGNSRSAYRMWRRDGLQTASPNAGQPMAAAAGALGVQLEKVGHYKLGDPTRPVTPLSLQQAERMVYVVSGAAVVLVVIFILSTGGD